MLMMCFTYFCLQEQSGTSVNNLTCPGCDRTFKDELFLRHHRSRTLNTCSHCHMNFTSLLGLRSHQAAVHGVSTVASGGSGGGGGATTAGSVVCEQCGTKFAHKSSLLNHMLAIHGGGRDRAAAMVAISSSPPGRSSTKRVVVPDKQVTSPQKRSVAERTLATITSNSNITAAAQEETRGKSRRLLDFTDIDSCDFTDAISSSHAPSKKPKAQHSKGKKEKVIKDDVITKINASVDDKEKVVIDKKEETNE